MLDKDQTIRRLSGWLMFFAFAALIASAVWWIYHSSYFPIKQVKIEGSLQHTDGQALQKITRQYIRGNLLRADLNGAQEAYLQLPWIRTAQVSRRLPDSVLVKLEERQAVARWSQTELVDKEGKRFTATYNGELPVFQGTDGAEHIMVQHWNDFQKALNVHNLRISKLIYTPRSAWTLEINGKWQIHLGREHEHERLKRFIAVWKSLIAPQEAELAYVDMRYKDGFAVRTRPQEETEQAAEEAASEANTNKP